jgi:hypothetical protein
LVPFVLGAVAAVVAVVGIVLVTTAAFCLPLRQLPFPFLPFLLDSLEVAETCDRRFSKMSKMCAIVVFNRSPRTHVPRIGRKWLVSSILDPYTSILLPLSKIRKRGCTDGDGMMKMETGVMKNR